MWKASGGKFEFSVLTLDHGIVEGRGGSVNPARGPLAMALVFLSSP